MPITNGAPVDEAETNPAFIDAQIDSTGYGRVTLASTQPASGAPVVDLQRAHNASFQDQKLLLVTADHSPVEYSGGSLIFTADLLVISRDFGVVNTISAAASPLPFADGESMYITLQRASSALVLPTITSLLPKGRDIVRLATRIGNALIFWDNSMLPDGQKGKIGDISSSLGPVVEIPTHVSSSPDIFTITQLPITDHALWLYIDGVYVPKAKRTLAWPNITLDPSISWAAGMDIEAVMIISGATPGAPPSASAGLVPFGSPVLPQTVAAAVGIVPSTDGRQVRFIKSTGGAVPITATPQIAAGLTIGQELVLIGVSDVDYITLADLNGLSLNGSIDLKNNVVIYLVWNGTIWTEINRR